MSRDLKVVSIEKAPDDVVEVLEAILSQLKSGAIPRCAVGMMILMSNSDDVETFAFGPKSSDLQCLGLMQLGQQIVLESILYPESQI